MKLFLMLRSLPGRCLRPAGIAAAVCGLLVVGLTGGCGAKKKETAEHQRKEAAHIMAEADFALNLRDWPRAEGLLVKAAGLVPEEGEVWTTLGAVRIRQGNKAGARDAYLRALKAYENDAAEAKLEAEPWLRQVHMLALLGRVSDARSLVEKIAKRFPQDREVRAFVSEKRLDQLLADPAFKQVAL